MNAVSFAFMGDSLETLKIDRWAKYKELLGAGGAKFNLKCNQSLLHAFCYKFNDLDMSI